RHLQQWLIIGVAVVMAAIMALSGSPTKPRSPSEPPAATTVVDPNQQRIEEYQRRIQEQAQRLATEQAQLQLTKEAVANSAASTGAPLSAIPTSPGPTTHPATPARTARDELAPHISDNVAFSKDRNGVPSPTVESSAIPALPPFVLPATSPIA